MENAGEAADGLSATGRTGHHNQPRRRPLRGWLQSAKWVNQKNMVSFGGLLSINTCFWRGFFSAVLVRVSLLLFQAQVMPRYAESMRSASCFLSCVTKPDWLSRLWASLPFN